MEVRLVIYIYTLYSIRGQHLDLRCIFAIGSHHRRCWGQNTSRIQQMKFKTRGTVCCTVFCFKAGDDCKIEIPRGYRYQSQAKTATLPKSRHTQPAKKKKGARQQTGAAFHHIIGSLRAFKKNTAGDDAIAARPSDTVCGDAGADPLHDARMGQIQQHEALASHANVSTHAPVPGALPGKRSRGIGSYIKHIFSSLRISKQPSRQSVQPRL